ncbi:hypothetical protein AJ79_04570 [Helicocarpus griseus UAMH5409]|uniref:HMG box domain-containing protein n=1 Tax=Helicocarpus griseus UAMH5409 TaxID=1447875 RepID=A0A2B7XT80_9EURO|nr:hypothetical protein AJ79_04570 [Helicocarpus griseus UAMH5409]
MANLDMVFHELGIAQYISRFTENGFETWNDVLEITELDLYDFNPPSCYVRSADVSRDRLGVKLGHRRRLQQRVARERNDYRYRPAQHGEYGNYAKKKRRYQWHPKPDPNAPKKPLTAYAVFANEKRAELQHRDLSFPEMAIEIGKLWRELPENEKNFAKARAIQAREEYKLALAEYEKSENYSKHAKYLDEWRAKKCARKKDRGAEERKPQSNTSSPQYIERSPVSTEASLDSHLKHGMGDEGLNNVLPGGWASTGPCHLVEHISGTFEWPLSQKAAHNQIGGPGPLFDNAPALGSIEATMQSGDLEAAYEGAGIGCNGWQ